MANSDDERTVNFTWIANIEISDISSVEILLAPARSIWDDHFDENNVTDHTVAYGLELKNGKFTASIPLKTNIYHFLFRLNHADDLAPCGKHNITYLANGRMLNYINVGDPLRVLLDTRDRQDEKSSLQNPAENSEANPLLNSYRPKKRTGLRRFLLCCTFE